MNSGYPDWDLLWLAVDRNNLVGAFITAGFGPVPLKQVPAENMEDAILEAIPRQSEASIVQANGNNSSYIALAERGIFTYDWLDVHVNSSITIHII